MRLNVYYIIKHVLLWSVVLIMIILLINIWTIVVTILMRLSFLTGSLSCIKITDGIAVYKVKCGKYQRLWIFLEWLFRNIQTFYFNCMMLWNKPLVNAPMSLYWRFACIFHISNSTTKWNALNGVLMSILMQNEIPYSVIWIWYLWNTTNHCSKCIRFFVQIL